MEKPHKGKEKPQFKVAREYEKQFQDKYNKGLGTTIAAVTKLMVKFIKK